MLMGSLGILVLSVLLGFLVPSLPQPANGVRSSNHIFSSQAVTGREIYLDHGCGSCHTQLVRAVVGDANLGPVTLSDSNQVLGYRRVGPDLAAIGKRIEDSAALRELLNGGVGHPAMVGLDSGSVDALLAYLREST
jgi:cbb3-type cytochrome oxidase cytochrome c subunit